MKKNKGIQKVNLIISVLIAFSTWLYVMYTVDPSMSKTYHDIPVRIVNAETLGENEMAVRGTDIETIDVRVDAKRSILIELDKNPKRIKATADVSETDVGENSVAIEVEVPYGASVESKSRDSMTVTVDKYESKTVPLKIRTKTDDERYVWEFYGPEEVTIEGYGADLAKVEEVSTEVIDLTKVTETGEVGLTYELPEGIKVSDRDEAATMSVYVTPRREVTVTVPAGEVIVTGLSDKLQCAVEDDVEITVLGTDAELAGVGYGSFRVTADAKAVDAAGTHEIKVSVSTDVARSTLVTKNVKITVTEKEAEGSE